MMTPNAASNTTSNQHPEQQQRLQNLVQQIDADVFIFSGDITSASVDYLIRKIKHLPQRRQAMIFVLTTYGGNPDATFRMAKFLQKAYETLTLFILGYCKSAGTLLAIAADSVVMSDFAELGPLDVQVTKEGDIRRESSLNIQQSLKVIREEAPKIFEECLMGILDLDPEKYIPLKVAEELASTMAVGLLKPIADQIDPARLGELNRQTEIVMEYGKRLNPDREEAIQRLISDYPSHDFVIDYDEGRKLLGDCVSQPVGVQLMLADFLETVAYGVVRHPLPEYQYIAALEDIFQATPLVMGDNGELMINLPESGSPPLAPCPSPSDHVG
jgi:hypothetical protein